MKLSEIAYSCQINPPRNGFSWKRLLIIITSKIWKGDRSAINSIKKNYTSAEHKELVNLIQSLDKNELKEFQEVLIQRNIEVLKERMGIKLYENDKNIVGDIIIDTKLFESLDCSKCIPLDMDKSELEKDFELQEMIEFLLLNVLDEDNIKFMKKQQIIETFNKYKNQ